MFSSEESSGYAVDIVCKNQFEMRYFLKGFIGLMKALYFQEFILIDNNLHKDLFLTILLKL